MSVELDDLLPNRFDIDIPDDAFSPPMLAMGADSDSAICLLNGRHARVSARLGDLSEPDTLRKLETLVRQLSQHSGFAVHAVAHDLHPHYFSTGIARRLGILAIPVQHHHAHIASVAAENSTLAPIVGIACDGAGFGADGAVWGCEIIHTHGPTFSRMAHLEYFPLLGGDAAAIENWRPAAALLRLAFGSSWADQWPSGRMRLDLPLVEHLTDWPVKSHLTSSLGRVFDAVAYLLGLCERNDRRARAAQALEVAAASEPAIVEPYGSAITELGSESILRIEPMMRDIVAAIRSGEPVGGIAARCHETMAGLLARAAIRAAEETQVDTVALSGGCFVNERLRRRVTDQLHAHGLRVLTPRRISYGDAGLALGQAFVARLLARAPIGDFVTPEQPRWIAHVSGGAGTNH